MSVQGRREATVSVAICTHNPSPVFLEETIRSVLTQDGPGKVELFVVDNNSAEPVSRLPFVRAANVEVIIESRQGLIAARRAAIDRATGIYITFVDDDNVLASDYIRQATSILEDNPSLGVLSGRVLPRYIVSPPGWLSEFEAALAIRRVPRDALLITRTPDLSKDLPIGAGMTLRASLLRAYFAEQSSGDLINGRTGDVLSACEDYDIDLFAISRGYEVAVSGALELEHVIPERRTRASYLIAVMAGSQRSVMQLRDKWQLREGWSLRSHIDQPILGTVGKCLIYGALAWRPACRVRFGTNWSLLRLWMADSRTDWPIKTT